MNRPALVSVVVAMTLSVSACYSPDSTGEEAPAVGEDYLPGDPGYVLPAPARYCPDETSAIKSDTSINENESPLSVLLANESWIAWKYKPSMSHSIDKLCIASKAIDAPTRIYLIEDAGGAPSGAMSGGDLYNTEPGYVCTLNAPFNFTGAVVENHIYWIATNAPAPYVAKNGARIPFWKGSSDPMNTKPTWTQGCSAAFVAKIGVTH